jgi:starch synthase (maltosyl-transferring)
LANTPDILPYALQNGHESVYLQKYFLAATLSSSVGIYGPAYEFMVHQAMPGKEEYLNSEKYEVYHWDWEVKNKLTTIITRINNIRKQHESLQQTNNIVFCKVENDQMMAYYKFNDSKTDHTLMICNLDPYYPKQAMVRLPLEEIGNQPVRSY